MTDHQNNGENADSPQRNRWQITGEKLRKRWDDRPGLFELQYYHLPMAILVTGMVVAVVDDTLDTHMAEHMAEVRVDPNENFLERSWDSVIHKIGETATDEK